MRKLTCVAIPSLFILGTMSAITGGCSEESTSSSSSSSSSSGSTVPEAGTDAAKSCVDNGLITVTVTGLPTGLNASITVTGAKTTDPVVGSKDLFVPAGEYKIVAKDVAATDPIARTLYHPTVSAATAKVCPENAKVTVTYAPVGSSGKVWAGNANGTAAVLGFASSALGATATIPASVAAKTRGSRGMAFDKEGNLWTIGGTTVDSTVARYSAASLAVSGTPAPDRKIDVAGTGCIPNAVHLAFDPAGNLWVSNPCEDKVMRLTPAQLAADGEVTPEVTLSITNPKGIAFDSAGNLWVSALTVHRYDASRLGASSADPANAVLTLPEDSEYVAFDKDGDLWSVGGSEVNLVHIAKTNLAGTGASTPAVASSISVGVGALPQAIAFDETGGLWISAPSSGKIARLAPTQLGTSTTYAAPTVPERVFTSADIGSAGDIAIFPAPKALPLYHRAE
jgi:sugar lactone lactonase YvrE